MLEKEILKEFQDVVGAENIDDGEVIKQLFYPQLQRKFKNQSSYVIHMQ